MRVNDSFQFYVLLKIAHLVVVMKGVFDSATSERSAGVGLEVSWGVLVGGIWVDW